MLITDIFPEHLESSGFSLFQILGSADSDRLKKKLDRRTYSGQFNDPVLKDRIEQELGIGIVEIGASSPLSDVEAIAKIAQDQDQDYLYVHWAPVQTDVTRID